MTQKLHQLISELRTHPLIVKNLELQTLCSSIESEAEKLSQQKNTSETTNSPTNTKLDIKSGCYVFDGVSGFFCPNCFDNLQQRINTKRLNSKLRVCPSCRASITPLASITQ